ncbi:MAG: hypothetical protein IIB82_08905 [Bacteroidetes bacterium]|nr:hypothetical protein [Bacteroidota bacterium]
MREVSELSYLDELTEIQEQRLAKLESQLDESIDIASKCTITERAAIARKVVYYMDEIKKFGRPGDN